MSINLRISAGSSKKKLAVLFASVALAIVAAPLTIATPAQADSFVQWVDGADDMPGLQDDSGAALSQLSPDQFCKPIDTKYYLGQVGPKTTPAINEKYYYRYLFNSKRTGIWQGDANDVLYADALPSDYYVKSPTVTPTKKPTTTTTKKPTTTTTKKPTTTTTKKPTTATKKPTTTTSTNPKTTSNTSTGDLDLTPDEEIVSGAPTAPAAPQISVDGNKVTVTWAATADAKLESVTGYVLQFSGEKIVKTDAKTTSYEFTGLADGSYRAAVRAVNEAGESAYSVPSEAVTVGTPASAVVGTLSWDGEITPGATVSLAGSGYAPGTELDIELHSDPVWLASATTDQSGSFTADVTVPDDVPAGAHNFVIAHQGTIVSETPVTVTAKVVTDVVTTAGAPAPAAAAPAKTVPPVTGVIILVVLAAAGLLALGFHSVRGGSKRGTPAVAVAGTETETASAAKSTRPVAAPASPNAEFRPVQFTAPVLPAYSAGNPIFGGTAQTTAPEPVRRSIHHSVGAN